MGVGDRDARGAGPSPSAPARPPRTTGLFHLAILLPTRHALALALRRVADSGWSLTGVSDHLVSESLYLDDPEGNGIELYRDRPREELAPRRRPDQDGDPAPRPRAARGRGEPTRTTTKPGCPLRRGSVTST